MICNGALCRGSEPWRARPPLPERVPKEARATGALETRPYLRAAAELVTGKSCGEGWLLQPKISDMPDLEYRWVALRFRERNLS